MHSNTTVSVSCALMWHASKLCTSVPLATHQLVAASRVRHGPALQNRNHPACVPPGQPGVSAPRGARRDHTPARQRGSHHLWFHLLHQGSLLYHQLNVCSTTAALSPARVLSHRAEGNRVARGQAATWQSYSHTKTSRGHGGSGSNLQCELSEARLQWRPNDRPQSVTTTTSSLGAGENDRTISTICQLPRDRHADSQRSLHHAEQALRHAGDSTPGSVCSWPLP